MDKEFMTLSQTTDVTNAEAETVSDRNPEKPLPARHNFFPFPLVWFFVIALEIFLIGPLRIAESDIWFHLRNAREMIIQHAFLRADFYTFTTAGVQLMNFEWLAELPYYFAFRVFGLCGLLAVYLVCLWIVFGAAYYLALRRGANSGDAALVTIVGVAVGSYSFGPRMLHFGWLCLVVLLLVLDRFETTGKGLWLMPPLFTLWINLHGSWVFGFVVLGIYIVSGLIELRLHSVVAERWTRWQRNQLIVWSALSAAALLINPYGYKLLLYPFELLSRQSDVRYFILEWQSVDFHTGYGALAMLMIFLVLGAAWFSRKSWQLRDILLIAFALWTSLTHVRFLLFAAILLVPILAPRLNLFAPYDANKDKPWLNLAIAAGVVGILLWAYPGRVELQRFIDSRFPRDAVNFMEQQRLTGRLLNFYDWGGYIEWNAPDIKTFADGRADIFTYNGVLDDYLKINHVEQSLELLDRYRIDYVLFPAGKHLTYLLDHSMGWKRIYSDKVANIYQRMPSSAGCADKTQ